MPDSDRQRAVASGLTFGAGLGVIAGAVLFGVTQNPVWIGLGIPLGAGLGIVFGRAFGDDRS